MLGSVSIPKATSSSMPSASLSSSHRLSSKLLAERVRLLLPTFVATPRLLMPASFPLSVLPSFRLFTVVAKSGRCCPCGGLDGVRCSCSCCCRRLLPEWLCDLSALSMSDHESVVSTCFVGVPGEAEVTPATMAAVAEIGWHSRRLRSGRVVPGDAASSGGAALSDPLSIGWGCRCCPRPQEEEEVLVASPIP